MILYPRRNIPAWRTRAAWWLSVLSREQGRGGRCLRRAWNRARRIGIDPARPVMRAARDLTTTLLSASTLLDRWARRLGGVEETELDQADRQIDQAAERAWIHEGGQA